MRVRWKSENSLIAVLTLISLSIKLKSFSIKVKLDWTTNEFETKESKYQLLNYKFDFSGCGKRTNERD